MELIDLPVVRLEGPPYDRGLTHGELLRESIHEIFGNWRKMVEKATGRSIQGVARQFIEETQFLSAIKDWTPWLIEEIQGIADGSRLPFEQLYMFNCTDENEWFLEYHTRGAELPEPRGCTSFGNRLDAVRIGQNMDIPGATDGYQVLLHIVEDDCESYVFSLAGMIGMIGLSSSPIGVVNNSMKQLRQRKDGLPVNAVVRGLLAQPDFPSAHDFITRAPHATGHNYIVAGSDDMAMFECSANQVTQVSQSASGDRLLHTNHPLENNDLLGDASMSDNRSSSNTHDRFRDASRRLIDEMPLGLEDMKAALSAHDDADNPVCRHIKDRRSSFSAGALIYEMTKPARFHLAPGPPCETEFGCWQFDD